VVSASPNENKISDGYRERAPIEVEVLIMGKHRHTAGSRSLHRMVRRILIYPVTRGEFSMETSSHFSPFLI
jgi:hypothetical protein